MAATAGEAAVTAVQPDNDGDYRVTLPLDELDDLWCAAGMATHEADRDADLALLEQLQMPIYVAMDGFCAPTNRAAG